jgi:RNA polymerase sigma factor
MVIKRRLMDEERRRIAHEVEIPVGPDVLSGEIPDDEEGEEDARIAGRIKHSGGMESRETAGSTPLQDEISAIQSILGGYGFSFFDLTECSPRSRKTKEACKLAVKLLLEKENLFEKMQRGRNLPIRELCDKSGLSRKLIDRHRRYIIAVAEILKGDFPMLGEYIKE